MDIAHVKSQNCWVSLNLAYYGIRRGCVRHVDPSRGWHPRSITPTQQRPCKRAITICGLDNAIDVRNALSEHVNVVVSKCNY